MEGNMFIFTFYDNQGRTVEIAWHKITSFSTENYEEEIEEIVRIKAYKNNAIKSCTVTKGFHVTNTDK